MRLRMTINRCVRGKTALLILLFLPLFFFSGNSFGQEMEIEDFFLDLNEKYWRADYWADLPFDLEDPYKREKNGPILTDVVHKASVEWISRWIANPAKVVPNAKMPNLGLEFEEIRAVIAYLGSVAREKGPHVDWEPFLLKAEDDLTDDEYDEMDAVFMNGKGVWGRARCTICHPIKGLGGNVGIGPDLGEIVTKINRSWLYSWLKDTKGHFPDTMMPQFRFSDSDIRGLVEYIMRDPQFMPEEEDEEEAGEQEEPAVQLVTQDEFNSIKSDDALILEGKAVIERARCFVCHDIQGLSELMPVVKRDRNSLAGFEKVLYEIRCLSCHQIQEKGGTYAPNLTMVGSKIKMQWEKEFLKAPDIIRPLSQQMPKFNLTEDDSVLATGFMEKYLLNTVNLPSEFHKDISSPEVVASGEKLFYDKGCNVCHAEGTKLGGVVGPNLGGVGDRLQPAYMFYHLKNPQLANPRAVEPNFSLSDEEIEDLVGFLADHVKTKEGNE